MEITVLSSGTFEVPSANGTMVPVGWSATTTGVKVPGQKELGVKTGLKGAALKRAHFALRLEAGKSLNGSLSAAMAEGKLLGRAVATTKGGEVKVTFTRPELLTAPSAGRNIGVDRQVAAKVNAKVEETAARMVEKGLFATIEEARAFILA